MKLQIDERRLDNGLTIIGVQNVGVQTFAAGAVLDVDLRDESADQEGLAAYGASGVQTVLELLQTALARSMAMSGRPTIDMIDRELVRIDSRS